MGFYNCYVASKLWYVKRERNKKKKKKKTEYNKKEEIRKKEIRNKIFKTCIIIVLLWLYCEDFDLENWKGFYNDYDIFYIF